MKKGILIIALGLLGVAAFAQNTSTTNKPIKPIVLRMTDGMSNNDIGLELINNFYKIQLSDVTTNEKGYTPDNQSKQYNEVKEETTTSNYHIILDLAVRTTDGMRPSLHSTEESLA